MGGHTPDFTQAVESLQVKDRTVKRTASRAQPRLRRATASMCGVCGNMSTGCTHSIP